MKRNLLCVVKLAQENVRVFEKPDCEGGSASYWYAPKDGGTGMLHVCLKGRDWHDVVSGLIHEAMEAQIHRLGLAWEQSLIPRYDSSGYMFMVDHKRFSEAVDWCAKFLCEVETPVKAAWKVANVKSKTGLKRVSH